MGPGARIGEYVLERELGRGAMGAVFVGRHVTSGARHALKVLHLGAARDPTRRERFAREARALARLDRHPGVVRIHAHGVEPDGVAWCALELVEGGDLGARLAEGLPPLDEALGIAEGVARALAHVHAAGIAHRDLKASNVLLPAGKPPVLTDFGIARDEAEERLTRTTEVVGTPHAMSPEQVTGDRRAGPPADVWALGVLLHELVAGEPPFAGAGLAELAVAIASHDPPPLGGPPDLEAIARLCLRKLPDERPTAAQVADALAEVRRGARCALASGERAGRAALGRPSALAAAALTVALAVGAGLGVEAWRARRARERERARALESALGAADAAAEAADRASRAWRLGAAPSPPDLAPLGSALQALAEAGGASFALEATRARVAAEQALAAGAAPGPVDDPLAGALLAVVAASRAAEPAALTRALASPAIARPGPSRAEALLAAALRRAEAGDAGGARALLAEARAHVGGDAALEAAARRVEAAAHVADAAAVAGALELAPVERALQAARVIDPEVVRAGVARVALAALAAPDTSARRSEAPPPRALALARLLEAIAPLGPLPREAARPFFELAHARGGEAERVVADLERAMVLDPGLRPADDLSGMVTFRIASLLVAGTAGAEEEQAVQLLVAATRAGLPVDLTFTQRRRLERCGRLDDAVSRAPDDWAARACRARVTCDPRETDDPSRPERLRAALADLRVVTAATGLPAYPRVDALTHRLACEVLLAPDDADALAEAALHEPGADRRRVAWIGVMAQLSRRDARLAERWARLLLAETEAALARQEARELAPGIATIPDPQDKRDRAHELLCGTLRDQRAPARWLEAAEAALRGGVTPALGQLQRALALEALGDVAAARAALAAHDASRGNGLEPLLARDLRARLAKAQDRPSAGR